MLLDEARKWWDILYTGYRKEEQAGVNVKEEDTQKKWKIAPRKI